MRTPGIALAALGQVAVEGGDEHVRPRAVSRDGTAESGTPVRSADNRHPSPRDGLVVQERHVVGDVQEGTRQRRIVINGTARREAAVGADAVAALRHVAYELRIGDRERPTPVIDGPAVSAEDDGAAEGACVD